MMVESTFTYVFSFSKGKLSLKFEPKKSNLFSFFDYFQEKEKRRHHIQIIRS